MSGSVTVSPNRLRTSHAGAGSVMRLRVRRRSLGSLPRWQRNTNGRVGTERGIVVGKFADMVFEFDARQTARVMVDASKARDFGAANDRLGAFFGRYACSVHPAQRLARALAEICGEGAKQRQPYIDPDLPWCALNVDGQPTHVVFSSQYVAAVMNEDEPMIEALFLPLANAHYDGDSSLMVLSLRALAELAAEAEIDADMKRGQWL